MRVSKTLYKQILGAFLKKGKRTAAVKLLSSALLLASKEVKLPISSILQKIFFKLNVFIDVKTITIRGRQHNVPFTVSLRRRAFLISKWLFNSLQTNHSKLSGKEKLSKEIVFILSGLTKRDETTKKVSYYSYALEYKKQLYLKGSASRSNLHFRW